MASSIAVLESLKKRRPFEIGSIAEAGHELYVVQRDLPDDRDRSPGLAKPALDKIRDWLRRNVTKRN